MTRFVFDLLFYSKAEQKLSKRYANVEKAEHELFVLLQGLFDKICVTPLVPTLAVQSTAPSAG